LFSIYKAVDGKIKTKYIASGPKCTHTNEGRQEWWAVDLGDIYQITNVVIYGRTDCCGFSVISWQSVLLIEDTGVPGETASH
jgi:hypothetical protein